MRAIKVWAVLCLNASDRFKLQVAQKRFLEVCEEMATSSKTPPAVKDMMFDVWSMLAYLFKSDVELQSITRSYNKVRPDGWPLDGRPLDPDHPVFNPASTSLYQPNQARPSDFQRGELAPGVHASPIPSSHGHDRLIRAPDGTMVNAPVRGVGGGGDDGFAGNNDARDYEWEMEQEREREREWEREREREREEAARNAREQCDDARRSAQLLAESLVNHGLHSEELAVLSARAQEAQNAILGLLPWVSAAAERSRDALVEQHRSEAAEGRQHVAVDKTRDELLLDDVLDAHEKLSTASGMVEDARNKAREDDEERRVLDQSMREQRMDRSNLVQDPATGQYYSLSQGEGAHYSSSTNAGAASVQGPTPPARRSQQQQQQQQQQAAPLDVSRASTHVRAPSSTSHLSHTTAREGNIEDQALQQSRLTRGPRPLPSVDNLTSSFASGVPLHLQTSSSNGASAPPSSFSAPHASSAHGHANVAGANASPNKDDNESVILTPIEPSEKALGKRRAVSVDEGECAR
ncbi:hypothetical protein FA10DRAFT_196696 [Acaromyces ingoldii]|uniref:VHS domain-containing protein n=1 Tax=Acaromyces ingoldii TaxID=215250 RepID=A0A316YGE2_9BASI|nr:hypothetical protein FA10DRAFT_196696 [Acaromyces ingoldii]PWN87163.1 hypothetical protein FA10DRAFT_196696 [Acaromyces ingoldii]